MSVAAAEDILVGIELVGEILREESRHTLGALGLGDEKSLADLRKLLVQKLPSVPSDFVFLTKQGWPVTQDQEEGILIQNILSPDAVIQIRRYFEKPRVGIRVWRKEVIGFVFVDMAWRIPDLRQALLEQMVNKSAEMKSGFTFVDRNGWPVNLNQESFLTVWDLVCNNCITLQMESSAAASSVHHVHDVPKKKKKSDPAVHENHALQKQVSVCTENGSLVSLSAEDDWVPSVLISYVRAEAEKHARDLKWKLKEIGFRVFLDIDEIRGGLDWQDELNSAVQNCRVFVPLITSQYGLTLWSNREVKLADQMSKRIIPVNFMDSWPPECLAIQFSSLQYIPWKTLSEIESAIQEGESDRAKDIRFWDAMYVKRVAEDILRCYETASDVPLRKPPIAKTPYTMNSQHMSTDCTGTKAFIPNLKKAVVVISVHPKQRNLATQLQKYLFANGNDVWCSTDLLENAVMDTSDDRLSTASSPVTPGPQNDPICNSDGSCDSYNIFGRLHKRQYSTETIVLHASLSDLSQMSLSPDVLNKLHVFREQVKKADIVIVMVSKAYCNSKTSQKQVYYCEHRKRVIILQVENFQLPCWLTVLVGNDTLQYKDAPDFFEELKKKIDGATDSSAERTIGYKELQLMSHVSKLEKHVEKSSCVYICGSSKFFYPKSENICHAIGQELAGISLLSLATGGFYGVGEAVGRSFCEEREIKGEKPAKVFHILPERDSKDYSQEARQNQDGTFQKIPYGQTIFIGGSLHERETLIARVFKICILIEGGPKEARMAEEFVWNDNIVIPVMSTGGAASGEHGTPPHILELPTGVSGHDWMTLAKRDVTVDEVAHAIKRIVCCLLGRKTTVSQPKKKTTKKH